MLHDDISIIAEINKTYPSVYAPMWWLYQKYADEDGFLYVEYYMESFMG